MKIKQIDDAVVKKKFLDEFNKLRILYNNMY